MLKSFLARRKAAVPPTLVVPEDVRIYAIGDIHGRDDLFAQLLERIDEDHRQRPEKRRVLILLGDLVDRGPASRAVVARAMALADADTDVRCLAGNHEELFLSAIAGDAAALKLFCRVGGRETALSYGITEDAYNDADYPELARLLTEHVPADHVAFLQRRDDLIVFGDYAFVHAGIRPGTPLDQQTTADLRWIRDRFLNAIGAHEKFIVHGHTITESADEQPNRLGIDTGAYASGRLTAVALEGDRRWFLST